MLRHHLSVWQEVRGGGGAFLQELANDEAIGLDRGSRLFGTRTSAGFGRSVLIKDGRNNEFMREIDLDDWWKSRREVCELGGTLIPSSFYSELATAVSAVVFPSVGCSEWTLIPQKFFFVFINELQQVGQIKKF